MLIKNKNISIVLATFLLLVVNANCKAYSQNMNFTPLESKNKYTINPLNKLNSSNDYNNRSEPSQMFQYHNEKLEEVVQKLENIKTDIQKDQDVVQSQLNDLDERLRKLKEERSQVKYQLNMIKKEVKTIDSVKQKIRRNIMGKRDKSTLIYN
ncbi:MAG: hypothetical protein A2104_02015 [Candidatus Melainabacteria bacterium GWF2_32_7]|nr:MAG: hypothetical protein A2104_02015 [Candidatus Melainabacteria bacterium GWF2_32_7]